MKLAPWYAVGLLFAAVLGCYPDRHVTDPNYEPREARRPSAVHTVPKAGAEAVPTNTSFTVWFDELMNEASVIEHFFLYPNVTADSISALAIDPTRSDVLYTGKTNAGILKSSNGGKSWKWITPTLGRLKVTDIVIAPSNPDIVYVATSAGVLKSTDAGSHWVSMNTNLTDLSVSGICVDRTDALRVFASTLIGGVFVSTDGAATWTAQNSGLGSVVPILGEAFMTLAIDPNNGTILFVGTKNNRIYRSTNSGTAWSLLGSAPRSVRRIVIAPSNSKIIYAGTVNTGVYRSLNGGTNWSAVNTGLGNLDVYAVSVHPSDSLTVVAGTPSGVYRTTNAGATWSGPGSGTTGTVNALSYHPTTSSTIFAGTPVTIHLSADGGTVFAGSGGISRSYEEGTFVFETWQDTTVVISMLSTTIIDTMVIRPFVLERALSSWIANGRQGTPPVDANPRATKLIFTPNAPLLSKWNYQVRIVGTYESDGVTLQAERGAEDLTGNSLQKDKTVNFTTE